MVASLHESIIFGDEYGLINSPAFYDCVVHLICLSGEATFRYNGSSFTLRPGSIAVITAPREVTDLESDEDFRCEYVVAPEEFLHSLLPSGNYSIIGQVSLFADPIIRGGHKEVAKFRADLRNIAARADDTDHLYYREIIGSLVRTMIYDLFDFHTRLNGNRLITDRVGYVTRRFFAMIHDGLPAPHREPAFYARQLNVTVKYLSETIRRVSGDSVSSHINRAAAAAIRYYLNEGSLSATQIADEMNFSSVQYFSRYCRKHLGMSPSQIRSAGFVPAGDKKTDRPKPADPSVGL